jgi:DNA polymerase III delta prime subunit
MFRFAPLQLEAMRQRLDDIIERESLSDRVTKDARQAILAISHGDMRKVLTTLQSCVTTELHESCSSQKLLNSHESGKNGALLIHSLDAEAVYEAMAIPSPKTLSQILDALLNLDFDVALERKTFLIHQIFTFPLPLRVLQSSPFKIFSFSLTSCCV